MSENSEVTADDIITGITIANGASAPAECLNAIKVVGMRFSGAVFKTVRVIISSVAVSLSGL